MTELAYLNDPLILEFTARITRKEVVDRALHARVINDLAAGTTEVRGACPECGTHWGSIEYTIVQGGKFQCTCGATLIFVWDD